MSYSSTATATGAIATRAAGGMTTAVVVDKEAPVADVFYATDAQQAAAPPASVVSSQAHLPDTPDERRQKPCCITTTAAANRLSSSPASGSVTSIQQITAVRQICAASFAASTTAGLPGAVAANEVQPINRRRRTASAAAPVASQMVTRSQAAALKHVQRMQTRNKARR